MPKDKKPKPAPSSAGVSVEWAAALQARIEELEQETKTQEAQITLIAAEMIELKTATAGDILELKGALTVDEHRINELVDMLAQTGDVLKELINANSAHLVIAKTELSEDLVALRDDLESFQSDVEMRIREVPDVLRAVAADIDKVIDGKIDKLRHEIKGTGWVNPADLGPPDDIDYEDLLGDPDTV